MTPIPAAPLLIAAAGFGMTIAALIARSGMRAFFAVLAVVFLALLYLVR